jgi:acid phosphatase (class A)
MKSAIKLGTLVIAALACIGTQAREPSFVASESVRAAQILPTPASPDSSATKLELAEMHRIELSRSASQVERAVADDKDESIFLFNDVMGRGFDARSLPLTAALSKKVQGDAGIVGSPAKLAFQRPHPYHTDKSLNPVCPTKTKFDSYPSGHSIAGHLLALVLADMVPEKRDAILARAAEYANNRVLCGLNYPSDLQASKLLAYSAFAALNSNPAYRKEFSAARVELRTAMGLSTLAQQP